MDPPPHWFHFPKHNIAQRNSRQKMEPDSWNLVGGPPANSMSFGTAHKCVMHVLRRWKGELQMFLNDAPCAHSTLKWANVAGPIMNRHCQAVCQSQGIKPLAKLSGGSERCCLSAKSWRGPACLSSTFKNGLCGDSRAANSIDQVRIIV